MLNETMMNVATSRTRQMRALWLNNATQREDCVVLESNKRALVRAIVRSQYEDGIVMQLHEQHRGAYP